MKNDGFKSRIKLLEPEMNNTVANGEAMINTPQGGKITLFQSSIVRQTSFNP